MSNATGRFSTRWKRKEEQQAVLAPSEYMCSRSTLAKDLENLERALAKKPLKPPSRRAR